jgi:hypothetical protein
MKRSGSKSSGFATAFGCAMLLFCLAGPGYGQDDSSALVLDVSPVNGGRVNLSSGVHIFDRDAEVTLIAVPNPGYQFVYWLGNVSNARASSTSVYLDSPKIVIAVFQRSKFEVVELEEGLLGSLGSGGLIPSRGDYGAGLEQAGGGRRPPSFHFPRIHQSNPPVPPDNGEEDSPSPKVPEPATIVLFSAGLLSLANYRHRRAGMRP